MRIQSKVIVLGASGFVGENIFNKLKNKDYEVLSTSRSKIDNQELIYFDLEDEISWKTIKEIAPEIIIDATGYGVVKTQTSVDKMYDINYRKKKEFCRYLKQQLPNVFWIQIGTAFEYDLSCSSITENTLCLPDTHYGISKLMFSNFLLQEFKENFLILRPFGMFGKYEDESKIFPLLIKAQKEKKIVSLSSGLQKRDYFFVEDLATFICKIIHKILSKDEYVLRHQIINIGSNKSLTIKSLAQTLSNQIENFDEKYWNWGVEESRANEGADFRNSSELGVKLGFNQTSYEEAFKITVKYYMYE